MTNKNARGNQNYPTDTSTASPDGEESDAAADQSATRASKGCAGQAPRSGQSGGDDQEAVYKPPVTDGGVATATTDQPWRDAETLRRLYHGQGLTTREIANRLGCSNGTVSQWLDRHDIETRENWTAGVEAAKRANRVERVKLRTLDSGYEYWASHEWRPGDDSRTSEIVYVHRLLAVAEYGFDAVADQDVHHENGIPWDNRSENITLLDKGEHGKLHSEAYWNGGGAA